MGGLRRVLWWWVGAQPGWFNPVGNPAAPAARLQVIDGRPSTVLAGVGQALTLNAWLPALSALFSLVAMMTIPLQYSAWWVLIPVALLATCLRPTLKLSVLPPAEPGFLVDPNGIVIGDWRISWSAIVAVHMMWAIGPGTRDPNAGPYAPEGLPGREWNLITVEVRDFTSISQMPAPAAGLANLSRHRHIILAAAADLLDPETVLQALRHYATHPEHRAELATEIGANRFTQTEQPRQ